MNEQVRGEVDRAQLLLIVDDDELLREALAAELQRRGFRVVEQSCGKSALSYLREGELPDLILLDLVMPNMDGWEFRAAQLQDAALAAIPVVALSGDNSAKARALHAQAFLPKPPTAPQLVHTVQQVLEQARKAHDAQHEVGARLVHMAEVLDESTRPIRLASDIALSNLDAALELLMCSEPSCDDATLERLLFWLSGARVAASRVSDHVARAELFAYHYHGRASAERTRVLVVDDDPPRRELLAEGLREFYMVSVAASAPEALLSLRACGDYDAIVCRLCMKGGSGAGLLGDLSATHPEQAARSLFLTGDSPEELLEEARLARQKHLGVLHGPPNIAAIRQVISESAKTQH